MQLPDWAEPLFKPYRYKVLYGGRASGKSYAAAYYLIISSLQEFGTYLCGREYQSSIKDSVHALLKQVIIHSDLEKYFEITRDEIRTKNGKSKFIFAGLNQNIDKIKSIPNIRKLWIEEGDCVSAESWRVIKPTILRNKGAEILITFNPKNKDDILYKEFLVDNIYDNSYIKKVNFEDNPFFPEELLDEIERDLKYLPYDIYSHIWLGTTLEISEAQVFKNKYKIQEFSVDESYGNPLFGLDFGFSNDPTAAIKLYIKDDTIFIYEESYKKGLELDYTAEYIKNNITDIENYVVRADSARPESISYLKRHGLNKIQSVHKWKGSVEDGIAFIRSHKNVIIHPRCKNIADEFRLYSYKVDKRTSDILPDIIDAYNHGIDALRYALQPLIKKPREKRVIVI